MCVFCLFVLFVGCVCVVVGGCASVFSDRRVWWCIFREEEEERIRKDNGKKQYTICCHMMVCGYLFVAWRER